MIEIMKEQILFRQNALFLEVLTILQREKKKKKYKGKSCAAGDLDKQQTERTPRKYLYADM